MIDRSKTRFHGDAGGPSTPEETARHDTLTGREREVISLIAQGRANKEIAEQLAISVRTVETHRAKIMRKLDIHSHAGLICYAMRRSISKTP